MLLIKTYLAPDNFGGIGLFAENDVTKGTVIWMTGKMDISYTHEEIKHLPEIVREDILKYGYVYLTADGSEAIEYNGDQAKYMNHSTSPNIVTSEENDDFCIAAVAIEAGDELTCDYLAIDPEMKTTARFLRTK